VTIFMSKVRFRDFLDENLSLEQGPLSPKEDLTLKP
jgi:hypothetical protein